MQIKKIYLNQGYIIHTDICIVRKKIKTKFINWKKKKKRNKKKKWIYYNSFFNVRAMMSPLKKNNPNNLNQKIIF